MVSIVPRKLRAGSVALWETREHPNLVGVVLPLQGVFNYPQNLDAPTKVQSANKFFTSNLVAAHKSSDGRADFADFLFSEDIKLARRSSSCSFNA